jgi:dephospho-CoA kinase
VKWHFSVTDYLHQKIQEIFYYRGSLLTQSRDNVTNDGILGYKVNKPRLGLLRGLSSFKFEPGEIPLSRWMGKYVIGITGNIATGKSTVRKLLEHLGAYSFAIEMITKRALSKEGPLYPKVAQIFGTWIFDENGRLQHDRLASLLFSDPTLKIRLDSMVNPVINNAIDILVRNAKRSVIVIESKKLLDMELAAGCDSIWVITSPDGTQVQRLVSDRGLSEAEARQRIMIEAPEAYKTRAANVVIENVNDIGYTWEQVKEAWYQLPKPKEPVLASRTPLDPDGLTVRLGMPQDADEIARFITRATLGKQQITHADVMRDLGEKAFVLIEAESGIVGIVGWRSDANVGCVDELYFDTELKIENVIPILMQSIEELSHEMLSEVIILILPPYLARFTSTWLSQGYHSVTIQGLQRVEWQEAALNCLRRGHLIRYKQLREDRVFQVSNINYLEALNHN